MSNRLLFLFWGFCMIIFIFGCATSMTSLKDYKPKSAVEDEIKKSLLNLEEAQNKGDTRKALAFIHDEARFQDGCRSRAMVTKEGIVDILERSIEYGCTRKYLSPKFTIRGDQADVKMSVLYDCKSPAGRTFTAPTNVSMVKEDNKWLLFRYEVECP